MSFISRRQVAALPGLWWSATVPPSAGGMSGTESGCPMVDWERMEAPVGVRAGALMAAVRSHQPGKELNRTEP